MLFCFCCCPRRGASYYAVAASSTAMTAVAVPCRGASWYTDAEINNDELMKLLSPAGARVVTYCYYNTRFAPTQPLLHILCRTAAKP